MVNPIYYKNERLAINPYRIAWNLFKKRLRWDLKPESRISRKKLGQWKNRFEGQKAVIICNGPSLVNTDLSLLRDTFTFGLNKINLLFDKTDFRPSCIVSVNKFVIEQNAEFFSQTDIPLFLNHRGRKIIPRRKNTIFLHNMETSYFSRDCSLSLYQGATVTYVALQLAFHMGFTDVALIGADHSFVNKGRPNSVVTTENEDKNHFDKNYFGKGVEWQLPDLVESERSYLLAREVYLAAGRRVVNATDGGKLEIFERTSLGDFVAKQ